MPRRPSAEATVSRGAAQVFDLILRSGRLAASRRMKARLPHGSRRARERAPHHEVRCRAAETGVPTGMASNPGSAPILFDRVLLLRRQERARKQGAVTFLFDRAAEDVGDRLQAATRKFADVADVWSPAKLLPKPAADRFASITRIALDSDSETLPLRPESLDLVVSALAFPFVNDLPGVLAQIRRALRPDGLLLAAMR